MPQTKEEILKGQYEKMFGLRKYDSSVNRGMIAKYVMPAMDEWAEQQSISFIEWISQNGWKRRVLDGDYVWTHNLHSRFFTTKELYELFQRPS